MILTGCEIIAAHNRGDIIIEPFNISQVEPNSYAFRLAPQMLLYEQQELDAALSPKVSPFIIPSQGYELHPGQLYLGLTVERTGSNHFAQMINGNCSLGALGVWVHVSAPLGHCGSNIRWTLEIRVVKPVRIYPNMFFGKIIFFSMLGAASSYMLEKRSSKYILDDIAASRLHWEIGS